ncbi:MAG: CPBP family intramembrane metalloprotease [Candidatus Saccharibacteria bacterium]|nr:CPBP family intramembrane metalloprotease [Candidatus Saccharibacteria bacterium]
MKTIVSAIGLLIWVGVSVVASQLAVGYLMVALMGAENFVQPVPTAIYSALSYIIAMVLIIFVPKILADKRKKADKKKDKFSSHKVDLASERKALGLKGWPTWTDIGLAPAGFVAYLLLAAGLAALFSLFPWFNATEAQEVGFSVYVVGFDRIIAFITLVVVAPVAEEIIFRGWLYDKLRGKFLEKYSNMVSIVVSNLLVSLLFGIVHMQWNVGVNVFAMSVVMCVLREITGTIYAGVLLHMLKNGIAFYLLYVLGIT